MMRRVLIVAGYAIVGQGVLAALCSATNALFNPLETVLSTLISLGWGMFGSGMIDYFSNVSNPNYDDFLNDEP